MPDGAGNFKGVSVPAAAWERIFGQRDFLDEMIEDYTEVDPNFPELLAKARIDHLAGRDAD